MYIDKYGRHDGNLRYPTSTVVTPEHTVLISDLSNDYNLLYIDRYGYDDGYLRDPTSTVVTPEHTVLISDLDNDYNLSYIDRYGHDDGYLRCPTSTVVTPEHTVFLYIRGWRQDADPLYINELDTINSLLHHKKHVRGSSDIRFVAFIFA